MSNYRSLTRFCRFQPPNQTGLGQAAKTSRESCSQSLARTEATPGFSEAHRTCFRVPCPTVWDSRPSTALTLHRTPRESPASDQVGGNGSQRLNPGLHNKCPSLPAFQVLKLPSHPRGDFYSRKGWEWSQLIPPLQALTPSRHSGSTRTTTLPEDRRASKQAHRCEFGWISV